MKRVRFTEEQMISVLKRYESGEKAVDLSREVGITLPTFYNWKSKYSGMEVSDAKKLRGLEDENRRLKHLVAEQALDIVMLKDVNSKKW